MGLYNYGARLYDPEVGRFITPDSIAPDYRNPQSLNRYAYVLNNPMRYVDPTGHEEEDGGGGFVWYNPFTWFGGGSSDNGSSGGSSGGTTGGNTGGYTGTAGNGNIGQNNTTTTFDPVLTYGGTTGLNGTTGSSVYSSLTDYMLLGSTPIGGNGYGPYVTDSAQDGGSLGIYGIGVLGSGSAEAGLVAIGAGATGSVGGGVFWGGPEGANLGGFASAGAFAGGPGYGLSYPVGNSGNVVGGAFAGLGGGVFLTNATRANQLSGPFDTYSFNIGVGPIKFSVQLGVSNGTWMGSTTLGTGIGISGSGYPTNTWTTR